MLKSRKNIFILYCVVALLLSGISCIGFIWNIREVPATIICSSIMMIPHLAVCFFFANKPEDNLSKKDLRMYLLIAFRGLFTVLAIVLPAILIGLIPNPSLTEIIGKYRYLLVFVSIVPIGISLSFFYLGSNKK